MMIAARILLVGDHFGADEGLDLCGDGLGAISRAQTASEGVNRAVKGEEVGRNANS